VTVWDSIKKILRSEGADLKDGLDGARDKLDGFLTEKEQERAATPKERMDMITNDMAATEDEFDRIIDKAEGRTHEQTSESELRDALGGKQQPATTPAASSAVSTEPTSRTPTDSAPTDSAPTVSEPAVTEPIATEPIAAEPTGAITPDEAERAAAAQAAADQAEADKAAAAQAAAERAAEEEAKRRAARQAADAKFEEQKAKAGDLLDELRGELGIDGGANDGGTGGKN